MDSLFNKIQGIDNPVVFSVWYIAYLILAFIVLIYNLFIGGLDLIITPILNTFLSFIFMKIIVGKSQTGSVWSHHYMLAYSISPWERFSCQENKYWSLFRLHYI